MLNKALNTRRNKTFRLIKRLRKSVAQAQRTTEQAKFWVIKVLSHDSLSIADTYNQMELE